MHDFKQLIAAGDAALAEHRLDDADAAYAAAARAFPRRGLAYFGRMRVAEQRKDLSRAAELAAQLLSLGAFEFAAHMALARVHQARGEYDLAEAAALRAAQARPEKPAPRVFMVDLARTRGDLPARHESLCHGIEALEDSFPVRIRLADGLRNFGLAERALDELQAIDVSTLDDHRLFRLSGEYELCGRPDLADSTLQRIRSDGEYGAVTLLAAVLEGRLGPAAAMKAFDSAGLAHDRYFDALVTYALGSGSILDKLAALRARPFERLLQRHSAARIAALRASYSAAEGYDAGTTTRHASGLPLVSLLAPIHRADDAHNLVAQLLRQDYPRLEAIVIVNGSGLDADFIRRALETRGRFERVVVQEHPPTTSLPRALNIGIAQARGDYIGRIDADDRYLEHYVGNTINLMRRHDADVCGKLHLFFYVERLNAVLLFPMSGAEYELEPAGGAHGSGSTLMMKTEVARAIPYDEFLHKGEDLQFYNRVRAAGFRTVFAPPFDHIVIRKADKNHHTWGMGDVRILGTALEVLAHGPLARVEKIMRLAGRQRPRPGRAAPDARR